MYRIVIHRQVKKQLRSLPGVTRNQVVEQIQKLGHNPHDNRLDIKRLKGEVRFRLRVGLWRIVFEKHEDVKIISIEKIGARGDVYK